jgi:hypothetical protein
VLLDTIRSHAAAVRELDVDDPRDG